MGTNKNNGHYSEIDLVLKINNKIRSYDDLIATMLHELVHCKYLDHDEKFSDLENKFRNKYKSASIRLGIIKPWDKQIEFPLSLNGVCYLDFNENSIFSLLLKFILSIIEKFCKIFLNKKKSYIYSDFK